jgi:D-sedoheptulose 7-phosphate isomerase
MALRNRLSMYLDRLQIAVGAVAPKALENMYNDLSRTWDDGKRVYLCGNGGSAGNAIHLANDFIFGAGRSRGIGLRAEALPANQSVISCLANDIGYEEIFAEQLRVKGEKDDVLIVLSGSGNSPNILRALEVGRKIGMSSHAILGFDGGKALSMADNVLHVKIDDMQIAEDAQVIIGHLMMQWLCGFTHDDK